MLLFETMKLKIVFSLRPPSENSVIVIVKSLVEADEERPEFDELRSFLKLLDNSDQSFLASRFKRKKASYSLGAYSILDRFLMLTNQKESNNTILLHSAERF